MNQSTKEDLKENLETIVNEFNLILADKGFGEFQIQNFKIKDSALLACQNLKYVCRDNGTCYLKCMD